MLTENEWNLDFHFLFLFFYSFSWHTLMEMLFGAFLRCSVALINTIFSLAASLLCMLDNRDVTLHPCLGLKLDVSPHRPPPTPTRDVWVTEAKCTRFFSFDERFLIHAFHWILKWTYTILVWQLHCNGGKKAKSKGFLGGHWWETIQLVNIWKQYTRTTNFPPLCYRVKICNLLLSSHSFKRKDLASIILKYSCIMNVARCMVSSQILFCWALLCLCHFVS